MTFGGEILDLSREAEEQVDPTPSPRDQAIIGKSPTAIALARLRKDKVAVVSASVVVFFAVVAVFCPLIAKAFQVSTTPGDPATQIDTTPGRYGYPLVGPPYHHFTWAHPFGLAPGTANDNLAYWLYGARTSLSIALVATTLTTVIGVTVGLLAGTAGGWFDRISSFVIDIVLSFPFLLGALALAPIVVSHFATNESLLNKVQIVALVGVLTVFGWTDIARLIRGRRPLFLWEPLLALIALMLSLNLLGDCIRDAFDPQTRK